MEKWIETVKEKFQKKTKKSQIKKNTKRKKSQIKKLTCRVKKFCPSPKIEPKLQTMAWWLKGYDVISRVNVSVKNC